MRRKNGTDDPAARSYSWPGFAIGGGSKEVDIRIPLALVRSGMRLGAFVPGSADFFSQVLRDRGIAADLAKLDPEQLESLLRNMGEITVDVDHGRKQVHISAE